MKKKKKVERDPTNSGLHVLTKLTKFQYSP